MILPISPQDIVLSEEEMRARGIMCVGHTNEESTTLSDGTLDRLEPPFHHFTMVCVGIKMGGFHGI